MADRENRYQNKNRFIVDILDYSIKNKLDYRTKKRLIGLIGKEIEKSSNINQHILERLERIEGLIKGKTSKEINNNIASLERKKSNSKTKKNITKHHNPIKVVEWLKLFTVNNTAIKFSTHLWDENDLFNDYKSFVKQLNDEFQKYKFNEMAGFNPNLYWNKIYPFLFQKDLTKIQKEDKKGFGWGKHKIKIGWQYPKIIAEWSEQNPGKSPLTMELPDEIKPNKPILGKTIKYFEDAVNLFKKEIEFRDNDLYNEIRVAINEIIPHHNINEEKLETLKKASFYTNTEYVVKAIRRIFQMIKSKSASTDVSLSCYFDSNNKRYILEILHRNSFSDRPINDPKIQLESDPGDLGILKTTLKSLCDFSVESRFKNDTGKLEFCRIEYLYEDVEENNWQPQVKNVENVEGFNFILKFPTI